MYISKKILALIVLFLVLVFSFVSPQNKSAIAGSEPDPFCPTGVTYSYVPATAKGVIGSSLVYEVKGFIIRPNPGCRALPQFCNLVVTGGGYGSAMSCYTIQP